MRYQSFDLYEEVIQYDSRGNKKKTFQKVKSIRVCVSCRNVRSVENEVLYQIREITGITPFREFDFSKKYKLYQDEKEKYNIKSFIASRLTYLELSEVI